MNTHDTEMTLMQLKLLTACSDRDFHKECLENHKAWTGKLNAKLERLRRLLWRRESQIQSLQAKILRQGDEIARLKRQLFALTGVKGV